MLDDEQLVNKILHIINGPIMSTIFFVGILLNSITIFILVRTKIPPRKDSYVTSGYSKRRVSRQLTNTTLRKESTTSNSTIVQEERRKLTLPVDGAILQRHEEIWQKTMLKKEPRRPRIYIYLLWMASCDMAIIGCAFMNFTIPTLYDYDVLGVYALTVPIWYTLSNASVVASVWLMLILVRDRYQAICSRLFRTVSKPTRTYRQIHLKLGILSFFFIIFAMPRFFELTVVFDLQAQVYVIELTSLIESNFYQLGYRIFCSLVFYSIVPYVIVFIMLTKICIVLRKAAKKRSEMNVLASKKLTSSESDVLIIVLAVRFLISRLLLILLDLVECFIGANLYVNSSLTMLGNSISNVLVVFTSATTFFVYVVVSQKFRGKVLRVLRVSRSESFLL